MEAVLKSTWFKVGGYDLHIKQSVGNGQAQTIVLVHGFGVSSRYYMPLARRLAPFYQVYSPDLPGFGKSSKPKRALTLQQLADVLHGFIQQTCQQPVILIGHSFGSQIVVDYLMRYPTSCQAAILLSPTVDASKRRYSQQVPRLLLGVAYEPLSLIPLVLKDFIKCGLKNLLVTSKEVLSDQIEKKVPFIQVPTLLITGEKDLLSSIKWVKYLACLIPNGQGIMIPNKGHAINYNAPDEVFQIIHCFIKNLIASGALV